MSMNRHQAVGAYQRWDLPSFDAPAPAVAPPEIEDEAAANTLTEVADTVEPEPPAPIIPPDPEPEIHLPTAADIERIHEEARKDGYAAGYEEGTARGRIEAMQFHGLVESLEASLTQLDQEVADEILALTTELARQMVRHTLALRPEAVVDLIREALLQLPQAHALIHINPDDLSMAKDYLGEHLAHAGHRLIEDATITRGGVRIEAAGSQIDATVQTRWRRVMDNLSRSIPWDGEAP
ncbi:flagellar assembly protein FliH [Zoogloea sp.]|uniref:flagellar assembly protein FliH n=1 Tax=Zoogloea sp. TaxID=49181 RepID=UPI001AD070CB|nr:flagellar assembly protein FliH [Zoogloea sp.]MBN8282363.1 flagellar assembly protein FliH [Zoogloea sp.]